MRCMYAARVRGYVCAEDISVELINDYMSYMEHSKGRAISTVDKYRRYLVNLEAHLQKLDITLLTATEDDLEIYTGIAAHQKGLKRAARRPMVACIKGFYNYLKHKRIRTDNPAKSVPYPTAEKKIPIAMALDSAEKMLACVDLSTFKGVRDLTIMMLLCGSGVRVSGLIALNEESLTTSTVKDIERLFIKVMEKGSKERIVPAPVEVMLILRAYLGHPELQLIDRTLPDGKKVLFVSMNNRRVPAHDYYGERRRLSCRGINQIFDKYGEIAGIPKDQRHPHAMRHLFGAEMAEESIDIRVIQELLGHDSVKTTAIYTKLAGRLLAKEVDRGNPLSKIKTPVSGLKKIL